MGRQVSANADSHFGRRLLAKHKDAITMKRDNLMAKARVSSRLLSDVDRFFEAFCVIREKYNIADAGHIRCDETLLVVHGTDVGDNRVELVRRGQKSLEAPRARRLGSLLLFVSATGHVLLRIFILKPYRVRGNVDSVVIPRPRRYRNHDLYYMTTESGVIDTISFAKVASLLCTIVLGGANPGGLVLNRMLLMDNLDAHAHVPTLANLIQSHVYPVFYPRNSTHFMAVLDDDVFGIFHSTMSQHAQINMVSCSHDDAMAVMWDAIERAQASALSPSVIKRSFMHVGLVPFNKELIRDRARRNNGRLLRYRRDAVVQLAARATKQVLDERSKNKQRAREGVAKGLVGMRRDLVTGEEIVEAQRRRDDETVKWVAAVSAKKRAREEKKVANAAARLKKQDERTAAKRAREVERDHKALAKAERDKLRASAPKAAKRRRTLNTPVDRCMICQCAWGDPGGDSTWLECEHCVQYFLCVKHAASASAMAEHEANCAERAGAAS